MSSFEYLATQPNGAETTGRIDATNSDQARRLLTERGLTVLSLTLIAEASQAAGDRPLSADEAEQLAGQLARVGETGLPLEAGLQAAAAELDNQRVADELTKLAKAVGQGASLEEAIARPECQLPTHVSGLISAAARTGRLGAALSELLVHQHAARALRRDMTRGFAYPLFVLGLAMGLMLVIMFGLTGVFQQIFVEFELQLPAITMLLFWWRDIGIFVVAGTVAALALLVFITRHTIGSAAWYRLVATLPLVGRMSFWSGLAEWTGLLGVLVHHGVPLTTALRLSGAGVRNACVGEIVGALATAAEGGTSFSDAMAANRQLPASLVPVIRWGERVGGLADALATTRDLLERRVRVRALMLQAIMPPIIFILLVSQVGAIVVALFLPLINLIQGLS